MKHSHSGRRKGRWSRGLAAAALLSANVAAQADGLALHSTSSPVSFHSPSAYELGRTQIPVNSVRVFGDYYLFDPAQSTMGPVLGSLVGGFRVSTGVVGLAQTSGLFSSGREATQTAPYIGLGYSHLWFKSQLSLSADFGLASQNAGGISHARGLFNGTQSLDDVTGDLRWTPVMAVNVRYSF